MAHTSSIVGKICAPTKQEYAGTISATMIEFDNIEINSWIIDSGATTHMCNDIKQLDNISTIIHLNIVNLLDGSVKKVTKIGSVRITPKLILKEVLYTPYFKFNLMSVNKVAEHAAVKFVFFSNHCLLQDPKTEEILAKARVKNNRYIMDNLSLSVFSLKGNNECNSVSNLSHEYVCNFPDINLNCKVANGQLNKDLSTVQGF